MLVNYSNTFRAEIETAEQHLANLEGKLERVSETNFYLTRIYIYLKFQSDLVQKNSTLKVIITVDGYLLFSNLSISHQTCG